MPCRIGKRKLWASRIELEATQHDATSFITLTYEEDRRDLAKKDLQDWLKRIRKKVEPLRLRFFGCGEYGTQTWRPHYHVVLFGFESCRRVGGTENFRRSCCPSCDSVRETWGLGRIHQARFDAGHARYVSGYVTKKMTDSSDPRLEGRTPEFAQMSRKPGLGAWTVESIANSLTASLLEYHMLDVPQWLRVGAPSDKQHLLLGRYMRRLIREELGWDGKTPEIALQAFSDKMSALHEHAKEVGKTPREVLQEVAASGGAVEFWERLSRKAKL